MYYEMLPEGKGRCSYPEAKCRPWRYLENTSNLSFPSFLSPTSTRSATGSTTFTATLTMQGTGLCSDAIGAIVGSVLGFILVGQIKGVGSHSMRKVQAVGAAMTDEALFIPNQPSEMTCEGIDEGVWNDEMGYVKGPVKADGVAAIYR